MKGMKVMKTYSVILAGASLLALVSIAQADDHLVNALDHGLKPGSQPFQENPTLRDGDKAPGQGSPFAGHDTHTPATDTEAAQEHAHCKDRGAVTQC